MDMLLNSVNIVEKFSRDSLSKLKDSQGHICKVVRNSGFTLSHNEFVSWYKLKHTECSDKYICLYTIFAIFASLNYRYFH